LCNCVLAGVAIIDPDDPDEVVSSDDKHLLVEPLWSKVKGQTGGSVRKPTAGVVDAGRLAFLDLVEQLRGSGRWPAPSATVRETLGKIGEELGADLSTTPLDV